MARQPIAKWTNARAQAMGDAMERIFLNAEGRALQEGQPFCDAMEVGFETGCECIASQLNALVHYYSQVRRSTDADGYGGSSHYEFMAELLDEIRRRALARNLTKGERRLA